MVSEDQKHLLVQCTEDFRGRWGTQGQPDVWWPLTHPTNPPEWVRVVHAALSLNSSWPLIVQGTASLACRGLLHAAAIVHTSLEHLSSSIAGGLATAKARRLRQIGELAMCFGSEADFLCLVQRKDLLALQWIREETADRILLYACHVPSFPVDRHVKAVFQTYRLVSPLETDDEIQALVRSVFYDGG